MENKKTFIFENRDPFQENILKTFNMPGIFQYEKVGDEFIIDTSGYLTIRNYLDRHTLTVKVFKNILENYLSIMEDSFLYYLDWQNYKVDGNHIFISINEQELKMIYKPIEPDEVEGCPIKKFIFETLLPYAKFSKDENWTFLTCGITILNTVNHSYKNIDVLFDAFALGIENTESSLDVIPEIPEEERVSDPKEKKKNWLTFLLSINKRGKKVERAEESIGLGKTIILRQKQEGKQLVPIQKNYPTIPIQGKNIIIGRNRAGSDIVLKASSVGKIHAELILKNDLIYIRDLNSLNGTYVNRKRLTPYDLEPVVPGDDISFSDIDYRLEG